MAIFFVLLQRRGRKLSESTAREIGDRSSDARRAMGRGHFPMGLLEQATILLDFTLDASPFCTFSHRQQRQKSPQKVRARLLVFASRGFNHFRALSAYEHLTRPYKYAIDKFALGSSLVSKGAASRDRESASLAVDKLDQRSARRLSRQT